MQATPLIRQDFHFYSTLIIDSCTILCCRNFGRFGIGRTQGSHQSLILSVVSAPLPLTNLCIFQGVFCSGWRSWLKVTRGQSVERVKLIAQGQSAVIGSRRKAFLDRVRIGSFSLIVWQRYWHWLLSYWSGMNAKTTGLGNHSGCDRHGTDICWWEWHCHHHPHGLRAGQSCALRFVTFDHHHIFIPTVSCTYSQ